MISHPFKTLRQFGASIDLCFLTKEDNAKSDEDIARITGATKIASLWQKHGNTALVVREPSSRVLEADALLTDAPGLALTIRFADCQNFVLYAPEKRVIGLVHAGWRGMCKRILTSTFDLLKEEWNIDPKDVWVGSGPSLCTNCADFTDPKTEAPELSAFVHGRTIDLRGAAMNELQSIGAARSQIDILEGCTRHEPEKYWTYRGGDREEVKKSYTNCLALTLKP